MAKKKIPINLLGVRLKQSREARGLTIESVAIKLADSGISTKMIEDWEKGFDMPDDEKIYALAEVYRVNPNDFLNVKKDLEFAKKGKNSYHVKKFVGKTLWEIFGDFIIKLIKIAILVGIVYYLIKSGTLEKIRDLFAEEDNTVENYVVDDEYLRMLNDKQGTGKDYIKENNDYEAEKTSPKTGKDTSKTEKQSSSISDEDDSSNSKKSKKSKTVEEAD